MITLADRLPNIDVPTELAWYMTVTGIVSLIPIWISLRNNDFGFVSLYLVLGIAMSATGSLRSGLTQTFLSLSMEQWDDIEVMFSRWIAVFILFKTIHFKDARTYLQFYVIVSVVSVFSVFIFGRFHQELVTQVVWGLAIVVTVLSLLSGLRVIWINKCLLVPVYIGLLSVTFLTAWTFRDEVDDLFFGITRGTWNVSAPLIAYLINATYWVEEIEAGDYYKRELIKTNPEKFAQTGPVVIVDKNTDSEIKLDPKNNIEIFNKRYGLPLIDRIPGILPDRLRRFVLPDIKPEIPVTQPIAPNYTLFDNNNNNNTNINGNNASKASVVRMLESMSVLSNVRHR